MALDKTQVGIIGLGIIGSRVAGVLNKAGAQVYVWNRTPRPVTNFLSSPGEVARLANVVQVFVTHGEALLTVLDSIKPHLTRKHIIMNHSTIDVESTLQAAGIVEESGAAFLDAPFTGSRLAAEKAALVYYVGGDTKVLERARPVLEATAKEILPVGKIGDATTIKIATNMISAATVQVLAEAYGVTVSAGIDPRKLMEALELNGCGSPLTAMKLPTMINQDYTPHFSLKNMFKDAQLALGLANRHRIDLPVLSTTASMMFKTMQKGYAEQDYSVLARNYQEEPGGRR